MSEQTENVLSGRRKVPRIAAIAAAAIPIAVAVVAAQPTTGQPTRPSSTPAASPSAPAPTSPQQQELDWIKRYCTSSTKTSIPAGSKAQAELYYKDLAAQIGFNVTPTTKLDDVLPYLGYAPRSSAAPITAQELQDASPSELMDVSKLGKRLGMQLTAGDVLVARFFAPKISDFSQAKVTQAGWRKLVLFRTQPGAPAAGKIAYGIILFNFFAPLSSTDPFAGNDSVNTQTILVGADPQAQLYWLDFDTTKKTGGLIRHSLSAFFDAGRVPPSNQPTGQTAEYFVPCGCAACHGGMRLNFTTTSPVFESRFRTPVLDYLDTDHWGDRILPGDDFNGLASKPLVDAGTFGVIQQVNQLIAQQNAAAQPDSMLRNAADQWVSYHLINGEQPKPLFERAHSNSGSAVKWDPNNPVDRDLLPKLNRYCFRCHGSVRFDVFDKEMVIAFKPQLNAALHPKELVRDKRKAMPPDRTLSATELAELRNLIKRLQ